MQNKYLRCIHDTRFGVKEITSGTIIGCDVDNLYIQALLDNGIIEVLSFDVDENLKVIEHESSLPASRCGLMIPSSVKMVEMERKEKQRETPGIGDKFAAANKELFIGCACKKDVIRVMNRWEPGEITEERITNVSRTIANKNKNVSVDDVFERLTNHCESFCRKVVA